LSAPWVAIAISETSRAAKRHFGFFGPRRRDPLLRPPEEARGQRASLWRRRRALETATSSAFLAWASAAPAPQPPLPMHQKAPLREARAIPVATRKNGGGGGRFKKLAAAKAARGRAGSRFLAVANAQGSPHTVQSDSTRCGDSRVGHAAKRPRLQPIDSTSQ
jgi:hypothetical protein